MRIPSKTDSLRVMRENGFKPSAILDVGIMKDTPELRTGFPDTMQYLFEPVSEFYPDIRANYAGSHYELIEAAASNETGTSTLRTHSVLASVGSVSHSSLVDAAPAAGDIRTVRTVRIDDFIRERRLEGPLLLKVDVDGAELRILEGASGAFDKIHFVICEASMLHLIDRVAFMHRHGYRVFDIVDICYYGGYFHQADIIFAHEALVHTPTYNAWLRGPFDGKLWQAR